MTAICSVAQIRAHERAIPALLDSGVLMDRAATAVATHCLLILKQHGPVVGRRVLLLVGQGDNGGDALFAGAKLQARGVSVTAVAVGERLHAAGAAAFRARGGRVVDTPTALALLPDIDLVVDGIVGLGSTRGLEGDAALLARAVADEDLFTVAVDVPSGVIADTGAVPGVAVSANVTVTFGALRRAHVVTPAALQCGDVIVADIGVPMPSPDECVTEQAHWFTDPDAAADKYSRGVVGVVTGSAQYTGAALLSTGAASRGGAGFVRYFGPAADTVVAAHPQVVVAPHAAIPGAHRVDAWVVGCGIGLDDAAVAAVLAVLQHEAPVLLDADALTALGQWLELRDALRRRHELGRVTLLTPHVGEATRLAAGYGVDVDLLGDRLAAVHALATATGAAVLLKGPTTLVVGAGALRASRPLGSVLATAGSGDVLAGLIGSALARWQAQRPLTAADVRDIAIAAAVRHAGAANGFGTSATDLMRNC